MSNEIEDRDGALAEASLRGNPQAFVKLATRWWAPVYRIAWNMSGSPSFAAEVTEQALLAGLRPSEWWPSSGASFKTFLYRVAMRLALIRWPPAASLKPWTSPAGSIWQALEQLDRLDRAALVLREIEQLSLEEAGEILGASPGEVRMRAHRALLCLTCLLGQTSGLLMSA
jgi:RNA polymerase sigma-70 factor (ECF subfamily)